MAFETLIGHLIEKDKPVKTHRLAPHIILRSNLPLFLNRLTEVSAAAAS
jgi:LacI family transcriptional regulator